MNEPVVNTFDEDEPDIEPNRADVNTAIFYTANKTFVPKITQTDFVFFPNQSFLSESRNLVSNITTNLTADYNFKVNNNRFSFLLGAAWDRTNFDTNSQFYVGFPDDDILINEVAPRPHNSGHQTIEASYTSQFEQHLRAILNLPLGRTDSKVGGVMVNLVGEEGHTGNVIYKNIGNIMKMDGVTPHIYGKKQTRPFRKMGHVTIVNEDLSEARRVAENVKKTFKVISE